jgi:hypothetical protein
MSFVMGFLQPLATVVINGGQATAKPSKYYRMKNAFFQSHPRRRRRRLIDDEFSHHFQFNFFEDSAQNFRTETLLKDSAGTLHRNPFFATVVSLPSAHISNDFSTCTDPDWH